MCVKGPRYIDVFEECTIRGRLEQMAANDANLRKYIKDITKADSNAYVYIRVMDGNDAPTTGFGKQVLINPGHENVGPPWYYQLVYVGVDWLLETVLSRKYEDENDERNLCSGN